MKTGIFTSKESDEESWMSISDLMAGLMIVFVFIAIAYIKGVGQEQRNLAISICDDLRKAFVGAVWRESVSVCENGLVIRFNDPETLFARGKATLKPKFKTILADLFPRYLPVLNTYQEEIDEVRIEGHTDDVWQYSNDKLVSYFGNMQLSQDRTRSVLAFLFRLKEAKRHEEWLIKHMTANGLSSSRPIYREGVEKINRNASRRVEFKIRLKTPKRLRELEEELK